MEPIGSAPGEAAAASRKTPRWRRVVAFLATFLFPGVSQADDGEFRKGILWFLGLNGLVIAGVLVMYATIDRPWLSIGIIAASLVGGLGLVLRLAIDGYRRERTPERRGSTKRAIGIYAVFIIAGIASGAVPELIKERLVKAYRVPSISMQPTMMKGDHFFVDRSAYRKGRHPKSGDIAVFIFPEDREKDFVKRIVAVPGDSVEIRRTRLLVNGKEVSDWRAEASGNEDAGVEGRRKGPPGVPDNRAPVRLAEGKYFMLGDNRNRSYDSRHFGPVDEKDILGKAAYVYFSGNLGRIGKTIR